MTEVLNADGTPHASNGRSTIDDDDNDFWFGFEQEYFLIDVDTKLPQGSLQMDTQGHKDPTIALLAPQMLMAEGVWRSI